MSIFFVPHGEGFASLLAQHLERLILLFLIVERVGDFLASVKWAYEDEEGSASHDEAEGAGGCVAFVICSRVSVRSAGATADLGVHMQEVGKVGGKRKGCKIGTYLVASPGHHRAPGSSTDHDPSTSLVLFTAHTPKSANRNPK